MVYDIGGYVGMIMGAVSFLIGGFTPATVFFLVFNLIDLFTGLANATNNGEIESKIFTKGIFKKAGMWCVIIVAHGLDMVVFGGADITRLPVLMTLLANEGISIVENAGKLGVTIPKSLVKYLAQLEDKSNNELKEKLDDNKNDNKE